MQLTKLDNARIERGHLVGTDEQNRSVTTSLLFGVSTDGSVLTSSGSRYTIGTVAKEHVNDVTAVLKMLPKFDLSLSGPREDEAGYFQTASFVGNAIMGRAVNSMGQSSTTTTSNIIALTLNGQLRTKSGSLYSFNPLGMDRETRQQIGRLTRELPGQYIGEKPKARGIKRVEDLRELPDVIEGFDP